MPYFEECKLAVCNFEPQDNDSPDHIICSVIETYASECKQNSICVGWKDATILSCAIPTCPTNSHYDECGPGCDMTCNSFCSHDNEFAAGCYCNENMVTDATVIIK